MTSNYKICKRCVMDTTASEIKFDKNGICNFCHYFDAQIKPILESAHSERGKEIFNQILALIKKSGKGKPYDSILGLSGGTDSSFLTYLVVKEFGLHPLVVNVDTGWDSEASGHNIKTLVSRLGLNLERFVVDWEEMKDLQIAFYRASVRNCEFPQDHAFLAALYQVAEKYNIHHILSGGNLVTESILPKSWGYNSADLVHLLAINKQFGNRPLRKFPTLSFWKRYFYYPFVKKIHEIRLLNYIPYNQSKAKNTLINELGWKDYGAKHFESILTRFFQGYYLPMKFGIDKRKAHLSSLILSRQIAREEALEELKKLPYPSEIQLQQDKEYIAKKLGLSFSEWETILALPPRNHDEFPSSRRLFALKDKFVEIFGIRKHRSGM